MNSLKDQVIMFIIMNLIVLEMRMDGFMLMQRDLLAWQKMITFSLGYKQII